jgi:hypothetical protein
MIASNLSLSSAAMTCRVGRLGSRREIHRRSDRVEIIDEVLCGTRVPRMPACLKNFRIADDDGCREVSAFMVSSPEE